MTNHPIFTIGHSNYSLENFLALLSKHRVTAVADVRSAPWQKAGRGIAGMASRRGY